MKRKYYKRTGMMAAEVAFTFFLNFILEGNKEIGWNSDDYSVWLDGVKPHRLLIGYLMPKFYFHVSICIFCLKSIMVGNFFPGNILLVLFYH